MRHEMNLWHNSFEKIEERTKTIEMRLNDEKRSRIKTDDTIEFINIDNGKKLKCLVKNIFKYQNFKELYQYHNKILLGYEEDDEENPFDMLEYYSKDDIERYGVVGIEVRVI